MLPNAKMALDGRLLPAGPMLHRETLLPSLPVVVPVLKMIVPPTVANGVVEDPWMVHLVMVLFVASATNWIVPVCAAAETVVLEMVREFPPMFKPSIVTLSAPLKLIKVLPAAVAPVTVRAPAGLMVSEVHELTEGWFKVAVRAPSSVSPTMETRMVLPPCVPLAFSASKAAFNVT